VFELDRAMCERCGVWVPGSELVTGEHECETALLVAFQTRLARVEIEHDLESTIAAWEHDPQIAKRVAFARYLRARGVARRLPDHRHHRAA
jgi:hypothetical protein